MTSRTPEESLKILRSIRAKFEIALEVSQCLHIDVQMDQIGRIKELEREIERISTMANLTASKWLAIDATVDDVIMNEYEKNHKGVKHGKAA